MISFSNFKSQLVSASTSATGIELGGGTTEYASTLEIPTSNIDTGEMAFVSETNKLYMWNGSAWFHIAMVNQAPTVITGNEASYALAADGTPTVITLVSTDPEGIPLTWSSSVSGDTQVGAVTNTDNVFTVTPSTNEANAGTLSVTFSVTDGNNTENSTSTFTLAFVPNWAVATQQAKIRGGTPGDTFVRFGVSVAIDGDTAIGGAPYDGSPGAAYVFTRSGSTWTQQAKLTASDGSSSARVGWSVDIDGDTAVVGAYDQSVFGQLAAGAAYIFTRSGSTWTQQAKLYASDYGGSDMFGYSVAIDGDTVIVGATGQDSPTNSGSAYIFTRSGSTWTQQAKIRSSDIQSNDLFGHSVAIDNNTVAVSAYAEDTGGDAAGAAYIFTRSGSTWTQQTKIQSSDVQAADQFGWSIAISGDTVAVGAHTEDTGASNAGSVYVFTRSGSTWTQQAKIQASDKAANDLFGYSVAIDKESLAVGAAYEDTGGSNAGAAYIFTRSGSTWIQQKKIEASDGVAGDNFGWSIAIKGNDVAVGAAQEGSGNLGAAYIFVAG